MSDKIIFGIDNWNVEYGWWAPNTIPADFVVGGVKQLPATHNKQWFSLKTSIYEPTIEQVFLSPAVKRDYLYHSGVTYTHTKEIGFEKYIFPVFVHNTNYFREWEKQGLKHVSKKVINDIKRGQAKLVFIMHHEGTSGGDMPEDPFILSKWINDAGLNASQVYYISCNYALDEYTKDMPFKHISINPFICWIPETFNSPVPYNPVDEKNLYLMYSRQPRMHRIIVACELYKENLLGRGIVSFWKPNHLKVYQMLPGGFDHLIHAANGLDLISPIDLDIDLTVNNPAQNLVINHYEKTFLSLVSETIVTPNSIFFSEKIYKPLATGHPFMLIGGYRQLEKLRSFGFQTYGQWLNEKYDDEPDWYKRISMIITELRRLSKLSTRDLIAMREQMKNTATFNQILFNTYRAKYTKETFEYPLLEAVKKVWNSF